MKRMIRLLAFALVLSTALPVQAQEVRHGSDDFKIGVAGYSYRKFSIDQTLHSPELFLLKRIASPPS